MKNCKGIGLLETITACLILYTIILLVLPQLYFLVNQRVQLQLKTIAIENLNEALFDFSLGDEENRFEQFQRDGQMFHLSIMPMDHSVNEYEGCISWIKGEKEFKECGTIKR